MQNAKCKMQIAKWKMQCKWKKDVLPGESDSICRTCRDPALHYWDRSNQIHYHHHHNDDQSLLSPAYCLHWHWHSRCLYHCCCCHCSNFYQYHLWNSLTTFIIIIIWRKSGAVCPYFSDNSFRLISLPFERYFYLVFPPGNTINNQGFHQNIWNCQNIWQALDFLELLFSYISFYKKSNASFLSFGLNIERACLNRTEIIWEV